jgi:hypothetical protein
MYFLCVIKWKLAFMLGLETYPHSEHLDFKKASHKSMCEAKLKSINL